MLAKFKGRNPLLTPGENYDIFQVAIFGEDGYFYEIEIYDTQEHNHITTFFYTEPYASNNFESDWTVIKEGKC